MAAGNCSLRWVSDVCTSLRYNSSLLQAKELLMDFLSCRISFWWLSELKDLFHNGELNLLKIISNYIVLYLRLTWVYLEMNRNLYVHFTFQFLYFDLCIDLLNLQNADGSYNFDQESVVNPETKEKVVRSFLPEVVHYWIWFIFKRFWASI